MTLPVHDEEMLSSLSTATLVRLVSGADVWTTVEVPKIGLCRVVMSDGPSGVRGTAWDERISAVSFPCGVALGASFDPALARLLGRALGSQARSRGVDMLLGPTINLQTFAGGGRHFENLSEEAFLTSVLAYGYVRGLQSTGVAATPKHLVANDSETQRHTLDVRVDERLLREWYLLPFEATLVDAEAWSVMAAYNAVNGVPMTESQAILDGILEREWGWDGLVVTDWGALRDGVAGGRAGLDLAMPGPVTAFSESLEDAIVDGTVPRSSVERKVRRLVTLAKRISSHAAGEEDLLSETEAVSVAHELAASSLVVAVNNGVLPLQPSAGLTVAVVGPGAMAMTTQGGGSAHVNGAKPPSFVSALSDALGSDVRIAAAEGAKVRRLVSPLGAEVDSVDPVTGEPGIGVDYLDASGDVIHHETRSHGRLVWYGELPFEAPDGGVDSIRVSASVTAREAGPHEFGVAGMVSQDLHLNGQRVITADRPPDDRLADTFHSPDERRMVTDLDPGEPVLVEVFQKFDVSQGLTICYTGLQSVTRTAEDLIAEAVAVAREADVTVVVVSSNSEFESEGFDRETLELPSDQDRLVAAVSAVSKRTVVVLNVGAPVTLPWLQDADAVVMAWFGGQEGPQALARLLTGQVEPRGRLPFYWPVSPDDARVRSTRPTNGVLDYRNLSALDTAARVGDGFPFGHGLAYGSTEWTQVSVDDLREGPAPRGPGGIVVGAPALRIRLSLTHASGRTVDEVVQIYACRVTSECESRRLIGFGRAVVAPGDRVDLEIDVAARMLCRWDESQKAWEWDHDIAAVEISRSAGETHTRFPIQVPLADETC